MYAHRAIQRIAQQTPRALLFSTSSAQAPQTVEIQKRAFPKFSITASGLSSLIPRSQQLAKALTLGKFTVTQPELTRLASQFLAANEHASMEEWRTQALGVFHGDVREITRAASLFAKLSPNKSLSYALYKVAAEEGHANAAYHYAVLLGTGEMRMEGGRGVGGQIIKDLAKIGHPPGLMLLAETRLARNDAAGAYAMLEQAAKGGVAAAAFQLGKLMRDGRVGEPDQARGWFEEAARLGSPEGLFMAGTVLAGEEKFGEALDYFERAAALGNVEAQYNVGLYYLQGTGCEKNPELAVEYWTMAAAERFPVAMLNLAKLLMEGKEVARDRRRARRLLEAAVEASDKDGFIKDQALALMERMGKGSDSRCNVM
ncbi:HCP-like protein [Linderina pennispora]|uniref:HCP-like protein n=1 Tax=Linderina pennispora TaxID=61395 RepID=A0A1Y1W8F9_9FUNG|nr:HCP-like protein [Linderina pennispora]ORX69526.1 HCP-like protein [Linderina pennispora]